MTRYYALTEETLRQNGACPGGINLAIGVGLPAILSTDPAENVNLAVDVADHVSALDWVDWLVVALGPSFYKEGEGRKYERLYGNLSEDPDNLVYGLAQAMAWVADHQTRNQ